MHLLIRNHPTRRHQSISGSGGRFKGNFSVLLMEFKFGFNYSAAANIFQSYFNNLNVLRLDSYNQM